MKNSGIAVIFMIMLMAWFFKETPPEPVAIPKLPSGAVIRRISEPQQHEGRWLSFVTLPGGSKWGVVTDEPLPPAFKVVSQDGKLTVVAEESPQP